MGSIRCETEPKSKTVNLGEIFFAICSSLFQGEDCDKDERLAAIWYAFAAMNGNLSAQTNLALMLLEGRGIPHDYDAGISLLSDASKAGLKEASEALYFFPAAAGEYPCECCRKRLMN